MDPIVLPAAAAAAPQIAPPRFLPDQRPAADAAALTRDSRPFVPLTTPPGQIAGLSQSAAVVRSNVSASAEKLELGTSAAQEVDRTLRPYGVTMLPDGKRDVLALFPEPEQDTTSFDPPRPVPENQGDSAA